MVPVKKEEIIGGAFEEYLEMNNPFLIKEFAEKNNKEFIEFAKKVWEEDLGKD